MGALVNYEYSEFHGLLPPPKVLAEYDQVVKGLAERIVSWPEAEFKHRRKMDVCAIRRSWAGFWAALAIALLFGCGSIWLGLAGHEAVASILGSINIVGVVTTFLVAGRLPRAREAKDDEDRQDI